MLAPAAAGDHERPVLVLGMFSWCLCTETPPSAEELEQVVCDSFLSVTVKAFSSTCVCASQIEPWT